MLIVYISMLYSCITNPTVVPLAHHKICLSINCCDSCTAVAHTWHHVWTLFMRKQGAKARLWGEVAQHILPHIVWNVSEFLQRKHIADNLRGGGQRFGLLSYLGSVHLINLVSVCAKDFCNLPPPYSVIIYPVIYNSLHVPTDWPW